jgi:hypothetical protein
MFFKAAYFFCLCFSKSWGRGVLPNPPTKKIKAFGLGFPNLWFGNPKPIGARPNRLALKAKGFF